MVLRRVLSFILRFFNTTVDGQELCNVEKINCNLFTGAFQNGVQPPTVGDNGVQLQTADGTGFQSPPTVSENVSNAQPQQVQQQVQQQQQQQQQQFQPKLQGLNNPQKCNEIRKTAAADAINQMKKEGLLIDNEGRYTSLHFFLLKYQKVDRTFRSVVSKNTFYARYCKQ